MHNITPCKQEYVTFKSNKLNSLCYKLHSLYDMYIFKAIIS